MLAYPVRNGIYCMYGCFYYLFNIWCIEIAGFIFTWALTVQWAQCFETLAYFEENLNLSKPDVLKTACSFLTLYLPCTIKQGHTWMDAARPWFLYSSHTHTHASLAASQILVGGSWQWSVACCLHLASSAESEENIQTLSAGSSSQITKIPPLEKKTADVK